ncbi:MAG TPA: AMP-binding protein [Bryobacteraceae bacterium]|jgi:acyl-CoA synthetase (AMP-forming)/AMP-acid ligase II|nr:AMP-binding protein [Bryobacteraceae bacterium]
MFLIEPGAGLHDPQSNQTRDYPEICSAVESFGEALASPAKSLVFLFCRNTLPCVYAYLGSIEAGHAVAMLDEALAAEFRTRLIDLYQPEFVAAADASLNPGADYDAASGREGLFLWRRHSHAAVLPHPDLALLLSTSGSTGTPKFVRLTRRNVDSNARSIRAGLGIDGDERPITSLPLHYSYGLSVLNSHLVAGAKIVVSNAGLMTPDFWNTVRDQQCTSWAGVPYSYQILKRLDLDKLNVPSLRTLTQAGGRLHTDLVAQFHARMIDRGGRLFVMYGQTEATARISILPSHMLPEKLGSAGQAIAGGVLSVDPETSEIRYQGPNVMMGYAESRQDLMLGDVMGGVLPTGDLGYLDADGCLFLTGRRKRDAKVFGLRLNMDEVEEMLRGYGPTAVIAGNEKLVIYCEHGDTVAFTQYTKDLSSLLKLHAGAFEFHRVHQLPLNANGKIDYPKLGSAL